ncbi:methyl-accepting chemotaxis protein [Alteromonas aestuariivivens]|uniref:Methyl-accepting chemotaxis protein n=1 Tax=Alteromonas aestuariivivens TaxID=1938339 RepID=A0A3D8M4U0_9ALTE|nr:methyl-accepting chemotaxis protein [Alteromonas aestuariivivens]RDV24162.1 methyl-accepting chemotaxis protein [Alteromonas aestuariivivens]
MNVINRVNIKTRILLLVTIPVLAASLLALEKLNDAREELNRAEDMEFLQQYVYTATPLLSAIQQELLYTKMYLGPGNPEDPVGMEFKSDMQEKRPAVDKAISAFVEFTRDDSQYSEFPQLADDIKNINEVLDRLPFVRGLADRRLKRIRNEDESNGAYTWTKLSFQNISEGLVQSMNQVVLLAAKNEHLSLPANAFKNLIYAQDNALLAFSALYRGIEEPLHVSAYSDVMKRSAMEETFLDNYRRFSSEDMVNYLGANLTNQEFYKFARKTYEDLRRKPSDYVSKDVGIVKAEWLDVGRQLGAGYERVLDHALDNFDAIKNAQVEDAQQQVYNILIMMALLLAGILLISYKIIVSINLPLSMLMNDFKKLAETKDMTLRSRIEGTNELSLVGHAFNSLITTFEQTLSSVREKIVSLDSVSKGVSRSMSDSMTLINKQRESTDNISVAVNEMTSTIHEVAKMASATSDTVQRVYDLSVSGEGDALKTKQSIDGLIAELGETNELVSNLNDEAGQISNILQVIKGISEQTNLLALNAAIEAARAGEQGRGFAVVADEVRNLSKRTQESTEQIQVQIETLINGASMASNKVNSLQTSGQATAEIVERSTNAFAVMKSELDQITDMSGQIAVAAQQQTNVADEINQRIHAIKDDSDVMYKQGSETLSSIKILTNNGDVLMENISVFHFN